MNMEQSSHANANDRNLHPTVDYDLRVYEEQIRIYYIYELAASNSYHS